MTVTNENGTTNTQADFIGNINPFRYRGYYYDTETGFYYLQTRYYDPEICRFINADDYELIATLSEVPGQLNLYAYCNNNPVMFTDETGESIVIGFYLGGMAVVFLFELILIETSTHFMSESFSAIGNQIYDLITGFGDFITISKNGEKEKNKQKNPDPYARPGQKNKGEN